MIKRIIIIFLLLCTPLYAGTVATYKDYNAGDSVTDVNLDGNFNNIRTVLNGGLDNNNANTDGGFRFIEVLGTLPAVGNEGRVVFDQSTDTLNHDTGTAWKTTGLLQNSQTWTGNNTWSGTHTFNGNISATATNTYTGTDAFDDLTATTADINGGTMDGVQIGGTTATGELIVNNSSDDADGLGSQGTAGQYLQSAGAGANPVWALDQIRFNLYTSNNTWTAPVGVTDIYVTLCGGGGGGEGGQAGSGGKGGGGSECIIRHHFKVTSGNNYTVTVGAAGAAGAAGDGAGGNGGDSSFAGDTSPSNYTITASGGTGGTNALKGAGATGNSNLDASGATRGVPYSYAGGAGGDNVSSTPGAGGASYFASGGASDGEGYRGSGGGGGTDGSDPGNAGGSGFCLIEY